MRNFTNGTHLIKLLLIIQDLNVGIGIIVFKSDKLRFPSTKTPSAAINND
ncbi:hypothetical protein BCR42DRAFT_449939 [Absidia repens]|uniref:Uncharacterized protein n=1 Tax=Absidia repens TaxID=90262 RepID=A0A1X2ILY7_9FUNG|nr:hypothetical protein BCR42DRAFT_449939 [Absidia repens]